MTSSFVVIDHSPVVAILESIRCLVKHQSILNTVVLGPMLRVDVVKREEKGDRAKVYTIHMDYDVKWHGRCVRVYIQRSRRWGPTKCTRVEIPTGELSRFEDSDEVWRSVHLPFLFQALPRDLPKALCDSTATVMASTRISHMPPLTRLEEIPSLRV